MRRIAIWVVMATLISTAAFAQVVTTGTIEVVVNDPDGAPLPGALVMVRSDETVTSRSLVTNAEGMVRIRGLEPSTSYTVEVSLDGFSTIRQEPVLVRSGQTTSLDIGMRLSSVQETVTVTAASPLVDTRSAMTGQDITLQLTESLPTARSYQDYLQIVPGVLPDDESGNPASKSGLNYSDIGGTTGVSRDNLYYFNGINVTDPVTGTFGANLNTEIIQEQNVITGGIPAEFSGTPGLLTTVVTKSGSNTFRGSVNYFFQNDGLVGENENLPDDSFNTFDAAATLGGPIVRDRAWFFGSYRRLERDDDVVARDTGENLRTVERNSDQLYFKATVSPTGNDTLSAAFLSDPQTQTGSNSRNIVNNRDRTREQGGPRFEADYSAAFGNDLFIDLGFAKHNGEVSQFAKVRDPRNDIIFRAGDDRTLADEQLGGAGIDSIDERDTTLWTGNGSWTLPDHDVKFGVEFQRNTNFRNQLTPGDASWDSLATHLAGTTLGELSSGGFTQLNFSPTSADDFQGFLEAVAQMPDGDAFIAPLDLNGDGTLTAAELSQYQLTSTTGNPDGRVNYNRVLQVEDGPLETKSEGITFFLQDTWQFADRFVLEAGLRTEQYSHFAATGEEIFTFDWTLAPRASLIWDVMGDGRHKLSAFYGIYYDPIRNNMTNFAGSIGGRTREEQVFVNDRWVTYRVRGGSETLDALIVPTTETPWTDDLQLNYSVDLGNSISASATYTKRRTRDILEDYNPGLYASLPQDVPNSLHLGLDYYGLDEIPENVNFLIATLAGGKRDYQGIELVLRKRYSDNWQGLVSYTYSDATGNTSSDSNADLQGDIVYLDPRAPVLRDDPRQPGSISHLFKAVGSYTFDFGLTAGGVFRWNSGSAVHRAFQFFGRDVPLRVAEPFEFGGISTRWLDPSAFATVENPSWAQVDLRVQYVTTLFDRVQGEFFVDAFNIFDDQAATQVENLNAGSGQDNFGDPVDWLNPRRFFLGARLSF